MTRLGLLMTAFPAAILLCAFATLAWTIAAGAPIGLVGVLFWLYGAPLIAFRIHERFYPLKEGGSRLAGRGYSAWYGGHQIQSIYLALPALEAVLRLVPGLFSAWLRLWGSQVGAHIYWTPLVEISDRSLLEIGDRVIFGHRSGAYAHIIKPTKKNLLLYVKRIRIGSNAFVGAGVVLAPGVVVHEGAFIEAGKHLYPNTEAS